MTVTCDCITCGDVALPLTVTRVDPERGLALCRTDEGLSETVETALVEPVAPGDVLLVHAGTAIARLGGGGGHATAGPRQGIGGGGGHATAGPRQGIGGGGGHATAGPRQGIR